MHEFGIIIIVILKSLIRKCIIIYCRYLTTTPYSLLFLQFVNNDEILYMFLKIYTKENQTRYPLGQIFEGIQL